MCSGPHNLITKAEKQLLFIKLREVTKGICLLATLLLLCLALIVQLLLTFLIVIHEP